MDNAERYSEKVFLVRSKSVSFLPSQVFIACLTDAVFHPERRCISFPAPNSTYHWKKNTLRGCTFAKHFLPRFYFPLFLRLYGPRAIIRCVPNWFLYNATRKGLMENARKHRVEVKAEEWSEYDSPDESGMEFAASILELSFDYIKFTSLRGMARTAALQPLCKHLIRDIKCYLQYTMCFQQCFLFIKSLM